MSNPDLTDKQVILQMIKTDKTLGFRLADPEYQNELVLRFMSFYNKNFSELVYDGKLLSALLDCRPVEGIMRIAGDIAYAVAHGKYRDTRDRQGNLIKLGEIFRPEELNEFEWRIYEIVKDMVTKGFGTDVYHESSWVCFNVWMSENATIRAFMEKSPSLIYQVRAFNAISTSRLRRFLVEEGYGSKSVPLLQ